MITVQGTPIDNFLCKLAMATRREIYRELQMLRIIEKKHLKGCEAPETCTMLKKLRAHIRRDEDLMWLYGKMPEAEKMTFNPAPEKPAQVDIDPDVEL